MQEPEGPLPDDPTPDDILVMCAVIRADWDEETERKRWTGPKLVPWVIPHVGTPMDLYNIGERPSRRTRRMKSVEADKNGSV